MKIVVVLLIVFALLVAALLVILVIANGDQRVEDTEYCCVRWTEGCEDCPIRKKIVGEKR